MIMSNFVVCTAPAGVADTALIYENTYFVIYDGPLLLSKASSIDTIFILSYLIRCYFYGRYPVYIYNPTETKLQWLEKYDKVP